MEGAAPAAEVARAAVRLGRSSAPRTGSPSGPRNGACGRTCAASSARPRRRSAAPAPAPRRPSSDANAAKVRQGIVVSSKGDKSITVRIDIARRHRTYEKIVRSSTKLHAHDERNEAGEGDVVRVIETRPLSKTKRWRLVDVVEKAR